MWVAITFHASDIFSQVTDCSDIALCMVNMNYWEIIVDIVKKPDLNTFEEVLVDCTILLLPIDDDDYDDGVWCFLCGELLSPGNCLVCSCWFVGWPKNTGPSVLFVNILTIPISKCMEFGFLLHYCIWNVLI